MSWRVRVECIHEVHFRDECGDCRAMVGLVHERESSRIVDPTYVLDQVATLERTQHEDCAFCAAGICYNPRHHARVS